eukprot:TRINITY_DN1290_c0_g1_i2.p1 TRINITY_DN1290_c0_g1~~TRINITY_DN1290_c0_g1_i2.p1  ORF type:complete len:179 (-),score=11.45 TRINITY_DN1290_c0_g1_i2:37-573(-)
MDHHCVWIGNCVGNDNHKYFLQFLTYTTMAIITAITIMCSRLILSAVTGDIVQSYQSLVIMMLMIFLVPMGLSILMMMLYQYSLVYKNITGLEHGQVRKLKHRCRLMGHEWHYPYDNGIIANFKMVFGRNILEWLFPIPSKSRLNFDGTVWFVHDKFIRINLDDNSSEIYPDSSDSIV